LTVEIAEDELELLVNHLLNLLSGHGATCKRFLELGEVDHLHLKWEVVLEVELAVGDDALLYHLELGRDARDAEQGYNLGVIELERVGLELLEGLFHLEPLELGELILVQAHELLKSLVFPGKVDINLGVIHGEEPRGGLDTQQAAHLAQRRHQFVVSAELGEITLISIQVVFSQGKKPLLVNDPLS